MSRRLTWTLILGVAISLSAMIATTDQDAITNLLRHDLGALTLKIALVVCAGGLLLVLFRENLSKVFEAALFWTVIVLLLVVAYSYRFELGDVTDRVVAELMPGHVVGHGRNAEVVRGRRGDFAIAAHINGAKVPMVIDTGATSVVLTQEAARVRPFAVSTLTL